MNHMTAFVYHSLSRIWFVLATFGGLCATTMIQFCGGRNGLSWFRLHRPAPSYPHHGRSTRQGGGGLMPCAQVGFHPMASPQVIHRVFHWRRAGAVRACAEFLLGLRGRASLCTRTGPSLHGPKRVPNKLSTELSTARTFGAPRGIDALPPGTWDNDPDTRTTGRLTHALLGCIL